MNKIRLDQNWVKTLSSHSTLWIGFSGGLDSSVLLDLLASLPSLKAKLKILHVNHGLSTHAREWEKHCARVAESYSLPYYIERVTLNTEKNIEENARKARYAAFLKHITPSDALLFAHHLNDQAETLLLNLLRGAGIEGLSAMPSLRTFGQGVLYRPLLSFSREHLEEYAQAKRLKWIEDESNSNKKYTRNFIRLELMPILKKRWPSVEKNLARTATICQEWCTSFTPEGIEDLVLDQKILSLSPIKDLDSPHLKSILRRWLKNNNQTMPSEINLLRIINEMIWARPDASPHIHLKHYTLRKYQDSLYLVEPLKIPKNRKWEHFPQACSFPEFKKSIHATQRERGIRIQAQDDLEWRFNQDGAVIYWHKQHKKLKKLWQEWKVPSWERKTIPLLYINGELAAVLGFAISDHFYQEGNETNWEFSIQDD